ncbi:Cadherin-like protein [Pseudocohnilembus persalinus]|uniref:Cadherin-like protein n=1 Tax=Pseudocohnilembus persalinus TaxID=266149 RepID=A0A0V0QHN4_PSEPJ|nr:Cadherin-like protein [Pseudocohnilembus persalinus]|eukprot:KRX01795.1 Cadherin-like protein [Pseudocohnilembus persalinus]
MFAKIIQDNTIISHFVTLVLDNIGFKIYNLYESIIVGFTLTEYYTYKNNGIQDVSLLIVGNIQYICLFGVNYGIDIYDVRVVEKPHKYQQNTSSIGIIQRGSIMQYELFGFKYIIVFRYEGIERLNIYDVTDSSNIQLISTINGEQLPNGTKGFANIYKINGIDYIFASDYDQIVVYNIFDIKNAYIFVRLKIGSNFIDILQFEIYLSYYKYETYYLLTTTQYQTNIIQIYTSGMFVQIPTISIAYMEGIEQSQEFPNKYQYYDIEFSQGVFRYLHSDRIKLQDLIIISNHKGIYIFDITNIDQVYLLKYLDAQYAKSSLLSYMQIISMNLKTYLQVCSGEQGIIQIDISDPKNAYYLSQIDTKYAMHFQTIQKNDEYYNIIADQIDGIKISKIYQYGVYPVVTQEIIDGQKQFNIKLKIYQPSYFQPYYSTGKFKLLDIQVMEEHAELNTFTTTPNWMTINLDQQIISLKPSTKAELDKVNKIYYVYSLKIDQLELQEYVEAAYPTSSLDYEQLKLELISFGHITKNMFIQDYIGQDYNLQLSSQFNDYLEGITGFLKIKQFHGHILANTDFITASNNPPVITCSEQYLKYELKSKQDTLCPQNDIQEQFDSQLMISLGLKIAKVGKYISFRFSEDNFYDYDKDTLTYSISNIKRTFENKTSIDGLYYTDISWLAFSGEDRILQGTPTTSYYNNILEISITASDGYDNTTALLTIDHRTIPPKYNANVDTLQKQFNSQNPNPQIGQPIYLNFQNSIPFIDEDKDELKYLAYKFVKSQSKFILIHDLNKYDTANYLSFNNYTLTFQGTVPKNYNKETEIYCVQAFDGYEYSDCQIFKIEYNDKAPKLKSKIGNQKVTVNQNFEFTIQSDSFEDEDKQLSITATQKDGSPLPEWLEFDSNSNTFYGTPEEIVNVEIQLTATDIEGKSVQTIFKIEVQYSIYYLGMQLYKYGGIFVGLIGLLGVWNYQNVFYNLFGKKRYRSYRKDCLTIGETYFHKYIPMISKEYYNSCKLVWSIFLQNAQENNLKISNSLDLKDLIVNNNQNIEPVFQALKPILVNPKNKISLKQVNKIIQETYTGKYSKDKLNTNFGVIIHHFLNHFRLQEDPETYEIYNLIKQNAQKQLITYANQKITSPLDWYKEYIEILEKDIDEIEQNKFPTLAIKQLEIFDAVMEIIDPDNKIIENTYKSEYLQFQNILSLNLQSQNQKNKNEQNNQDNNNDQETNNQNKKINFLLLKNAIISEAKMQETIIVGKSRQVNIVKALGIKRHPFFQAGFIRFLKNEQYNIEGHMNDPLPSWLQFEFLHKTAILLQGIPQSLEDQELIIQIQDNHSFILREYLLDIKKPGNQKKIKLTKFNTFYTLKMSQEKKSQSVSLNRIQNNQNTDHYLDKTKQPLMDASQQSYSNTTLEQIDEDIPKDQQNISNKSLIYQSRKQKQISKMEENFENISKISNRINLQNQILNLSSNKLNAQDNQLTNKNINNFDNQLLFDESNDTLRTNRYTHTQNQTQIDSISNLMSSKNAYENQNNQQIKINFNQDKKHIYPKLQNKQISIRIDDETNSKQQIQKLEQKKRKIQNFNGNDKQSPIIMEKNKFQQQQINDNDDNYIVFDSTFSLKKNNSSYPKVKDQEQIDADQINEENEN